MCIGQNIYKYPKWHIIENILRKLLNHGAFYIMFQVKHYNIYQKKINVL